MQRIAGLKYRHSCRIQKAPNMRQSRIIDEYTFIGNLVVGQIADAYVNDTDIPCPFCDEPLKHSPRQQGLSASGDSWNIQKAFFECQNSDCDRYDEAFNIDAINKHAAACGAKYRG